MGTNNPRVVLVHGSAQGSSVGGERHFSRQSRLATQGWDLIVPDRPGHGRSPAPGRPDDPELDGAWVSELLGGGAHLVGHSFGGCVALGAAILRPEAVRSLTLIEPALQSLCAGEPEMEEWVAAIKNVYATSKTPAEIAIGFQKIAGIPMGLLADNAPGTQHGDPEEIDRLGHGLMQLRLPTKEWIEAGLQKLAEAGVPILVVSGGWNPGIDLTARKAAQIGGGRHEIVPAEHHFPHLMGDRFNTLFADFMRGADAGVRQEAHAQAR